MKKRIIGALVGGLIIFLWQFLSYAAGNFHKAAVQYTPKQDTVMAYLNSLNLPEGGYLMPNAPPGAGKAEWDALMANNLGKPWASVQYHAALENNMIQNAVRSYLTDVIIVLLFAMLVSRFRVSSFGSILSAALLTGLIVFLNGPYTGNIWYPMFDIWMHLVDALVCWALVGIWLGWWLRRGVTENGER